MSVVQFPGGRQPAPQEPKDSHGVGAAFCIGCRHEWQGIAPTGTTELECPACRTMKGRWKFEFAPEIAWHCLCGNPYFYITAEGHMCANCGIYQEY